MAAAGYILNVPPRRTKKLLEAADEGEARGYSNVGEPVPRFEHSRRSPLVVFASFSLAALTHIANGRKGVAAGTGLVRLNLDDLKALKTPIPYATLIGAVPKRLQHHLQKALDQGGMIPPKTLSAVVDVLTNMDDSLGPRLFRFSEKRRIRVAALSPKVRANLALQKETVGLALEIAGLPREQLLAWTPQDEQRSFLDGLPQAYVREDAMIVGDLSKVPGFEAIDDGITQIASRTFQAAGNPSLKLTVVMANKLALEEQTGADLIYYNETFRSFVMVQYKAMGRGRRGPEFRWQDGDQLAEEIGRMDKILVELAKVPADADPDGFRFTQNPFLLKFCSRVNFDPDDKGLFPGIYLPLDLWKQLASSERLKGDKDGNVLTYENVGRRLTNSEFAALVGKAWIGTTMGQSVHMEQLVRDVLATGKTITFAVKHKEPPRPKGHVGEVTDYDPLEGFDFTDEKPEEEPPDLA